VTGLAVILGSVGALFTNLRDRARAEDDTRLASDLDWARRRTLARILLLLERQGSITRDKVNEIVAQELAFARHTLARDMDPAPWADDKIRELMSAGTN
jgi:hypothetical protein